MKHLVHTITKDDIGKSLLRLRGRTVSLLDSIGRVQAIDVGKRVYVVDGVYQVENEAQLAARLRTAGDGTQVPPYGTVTNRALPYGASALDYLELALACLDQINVPLQDALEALPPHTREMVQDLPWVWRSIRDNRRTGS